MSAVCFYFQLHQPRRLRRFSYFDRCLANDYFDHDLDRDVLSRVTKNCYLPTNRLLLDLCERLGDRFSVAFSASGVFLEQLAEREPECLRSFQMLAETGRVEFLGETFHHSLASLYDADEFRDQVTLHSDLVEKLFGRRPAGFRNTELIYHDVVADEAERLGFSFVLAEGIPALLGPEGPYVVRKPHGRKLTVLTRDAAASDDIAYRFTPQTGPGRSPTPREFLDSLRGGEDALHCLFMDYETFGEHHAESSGIREFLGGVMTAAATGGHALLTPSAAATYGPAPLSLPYDTLSSWADQERDASAWNGNRVQRSALSRVYDLAEAVKWYGDPKLTETWRRLQTSDHFYYMSTKWRTDGLVHSYFSPFESPYDAFITYMNVLKDLGSTVISKSGRDGTRAA